MDLEKGPNRAINKTNNNKINFSVYYSSKTKFHYKKEVVIKTFYPYIFIYFMS